jgi:hypothetical protein
MSFNNLSKNKKEQIINMSIKSNEHILYESLLRLGIDPSSFDIDSFDIDTVKTSSTSEHFVKDLMQSISSLKFIKKEIELLEQ